jgi:hypothetical protein
MTTVEIAEHVNANELYRKRDGLPVTPFQIHGRIRQYPRLFTRDGSTVALTKWDASTTRVFAPEYSPRLPVRQQPHDIPGEIEPAEIKSSLLDVSGFRPAGAIDPEVPDRPGLYAIRLGSRTALPGPFQRIAEARGSDLIYIGIASKSLSRRLLGQELRARGHGTFFRSIGAVLGFRPAPGSLIGKGNRRNYTFSREDNRAIIDWINSNLVVNWVEFSGSHAIEESALLRKHTPLLNLQGNPGALPHLRHSAPNLCASPTLFCLVDQQTRGQLNSSAFAPHPFCHQERSLSARAPRSTQ